MPNDAVRAFLEAVMKRGHQSETTWLTPSEERAYKAWVRANGITDADRAGSRYDYRGYFKESGGAPIRFGVDHFTDTYKRHGHPLFSAESKYSRGPWDGGQWLPGDVLVDPPMPSHGRK